MWGRFLNADSIGYLNSTAINGLNLFAYCGNNPVMGYDPDGTISSKTIWEIIGTIAIVALVGTAFIINPALGVTVLTSTITGGFINGGLAALQGDDILGAMIIGGLEGAATGFSAGLGGLTLTKSFLANPFVAKAFIPISSGLAYGLGYAIDITSNNKKFSMGALISNITLGALLGELNFGVGKLLKGISNPPQPSTFEEIADYCAAFIGKTLIQSTNINLFTWSSQTIINGVFYPSI